MIVSSGIDPGRPTPLPGIDSSNWCGRPEIAPAVNFSSAVFICQENSSAPLGRVGPASLSQRPPVCVVLNLGY